MPSGHTGLPHYDARAGDVVERVKHTAEDYPVSKWQRVASPVWMDIDPSDTLQYASAREHDDERHICPLQLEVIRRGVELWTNPGDIVYRRSRDRQRRICDAANGAPVYWRRAEKQLLPASRAQSACGIADDGRLVRRSVMQSKLTTPAKWAASIFDPAPPSQTLRRWCREGRIVGARK